MVTPISEKNKHIEDYLDYYCNYPHAPKFAVLIKGKWGSGKTWFIEEYREKLAKKAKLDNTGKKSLYVSLYGMTNVSDIGNSLYQQLHPVLSSPGMVIANKVVKGLLKGGLKIDLNTNDNKTDDFIWNLGIPDIERMKDEYSDSKFSLLVFDDLERCQIKLESLLGYINSFVDSYDLKVVIIGNEEELISKEKKYQKFKEKLIGQTFELSPDLHAALKKFIENIETPEVKQIFDAHIELIKNLYKQSEYNNLRTLNKIVLDFERIFNGLPNKAKEHPDVIKDIIEILIIFSIEIHQGNLEPSVIGKLKNKLEEEHKAFSKMKTEESQNFNIQEKTQKTDNKLHYIKIFFKYNSMRNEETITYNYNTLIINMYKFKTLFPDLLWWEDFFNKGIVNIPILETTLSNSKYFQDENTTNWRELINFEYCSDEKFKNIINSLHLEYKARKYEEIYEVKNITMLFFYFSNLGLYNEIKPNILQEAKEYIDYLKDNNKLDWKFYEDAASKVKSRLSEVLDYPEYQKFDNYLKKAKEKIKITNESQNILKLMEDNLDKFCENIGESPLPVEFSDGEYYDYPIFKYTDAEKFVNIIGKISNEKLQVFFEALQYRYLDSLKNQVHIHSLGKKLIEEIDFLEKVQNLLLNLINEREGELSGHLLKLAKKNYLDKVIDKIKEKTNEIQNT